MTGPAKWELRFPEHPQMEPSEFEGRDWEAEENAKEDAHIAKRKGE